MDFVENKSVITYLTLTEQFPELALEEIQGDQMVHHTVRIDVVKLIDTDRKTSLYCRCLHYELLTFLDIFQSNWPCLS